MTLLYHLILSVGVVVYAGLFAIKKVVKKDLISHKTMLGAPLAAGTVGSYLVTKKLTKDCYSMWMILEGKISTFAPEHSGEGMLLLSSTMAVLLS